MKKLLIYRLRVLKKMHKNAIAKNNYVFAQNISIRMDEINDLLYLLKKEINITSTNYYDEDQEASLI